MSISFKSNRYHLNIPKFSKIPWRPPLKKRWFKYKPNIDFYEETTTSIIAFILEQYNVRNFFDIGASTGYFTRLCLSFLPREVNIYAFEMLPTRLSELKSAIHDTIRENQIGKAYCAGLSSLHKGMTTVWYSVTRLYETKPDEKIYRDPWWTKIKFALRGKLNRDELTKVEIEITTIDEFTRRTNVIPDLIKIDVDGHEALVLEGGQRTFREHAPLILLELHKDKFLAKTNRDRYAVVKILFNLGYKAILIDDHHDLRTKIIDVSEGDSLIGRQMTDMLLFWSEKCISRIGVTELINEKTSQKKGRQTG